mgnify:FL=1
MSIARNLSTLASNLDSTGKLTSNAISADASSALASGVEIYDSINLIPLVNIDQGDLAFVTGNNRFYLSNGTGWYNIALVNEDPAITLETTTYIIEDGDSATVTPTATDPEGFPITWSSAFTSGDSNAFNVVQVDNEFTVTIDSADTGVANWQIRASDGINVAIKNVGLVTPTPGSGLSQAYSAVSADAILTKLGTAAVNGYYWILPSGSAESAVLTYCYFDHDNNKGYMLLVSADHSNANTMINGNASTSVGLVLESDNVTTVDGTTHDILTADTYWRVSRDFFDRLETGSGGSMEILILANSDTSTPMTAWSQITHTHSTGDVLTDTPGAFCRSSSNGSYNMGGGYYLMDWSGFAYGSYHQGIATNTGYHANDPGSHWGHFHRSGVNSGVYAFGDNVYIQEVEWDARYFYFIR